MTYNCKYDMPLLAGLLCMCFFTCQLKPTMETPQEIADTAILIGTYSGFDSALSCAYEHSDSANAVVRSAIERAKRDGVPIIFAPPVVDTVKTTGHPFGAYRNK